MNCLEYKNTRTPRIFARIILCFLMFLCSFLKLAAQGKVIYVVTDIHVMDSSLIIKEGEALTNYLANDRKMLNQSTEAFAAVVDSAIIHKADALLICGDLTKDGEKIGHERVARMLRKALQAGVKPFVIPGNHDIRNPFAKYFDDDKTYPAEWVTAEEFASIYRDFGYGHDILRDTHSLSYVCEPIPGLTLLAIDASQYENNTSTAHGDDKDVSIVGGAIKPATLDWLLTQADEAKNKGNQVVAMMHQQLIDHVDGFHKIIDYAAIENGDSIANLLMEHGVHLIFTGHLHSTDVATTWNDNHTVSLTDVSTCSTISYPSHYRVIRVSDDCSTLTIDTHRINSLPSQPDFIQFGHTFMENGMESMTYALSREQWGLIEQTMKEYFKDINLGIASVTFRLPTTPDEFASLVYKHLGSFISDGWFSVQEGNEYDQDVYDRYYKTIKSGVYKILGEIIENDIYLLGKPLGRTEARDAIMEKLTPMLQSMFYDLTHVGTINEDRTDDLHFNINLETGKILTDSEMTGITKNKLTVSDNTTNISIYNLQGQLVNKHQDTALPAGCYIVKTNNRTIKILVKHEN